MNTHKGKLGLYNTIKKKTNKTIHHNVIKEPIL